MSLAQNTAHLVTGVALVEGDGAGYLCIKTWVHALLAIGPPSIIGLQARGDGGAVELVGAVEVVRGTGTGNMHRTLLVSQSS